MRYRYIPKSSLPYSGHGLPVFSGMDFQRGHGIAGVLSSLMRKAIPFILPVAKKIGKSLGKKLLQTGSRVAQDVIMHKKPIKSSMRQRGSEALVQFLDDPSSKKRKISKAKLKNKKRRRKVQREDIFY